MIPDATAWIRAALAEDVGAGDATTLALVPETARGDAAIVAREPCVMAGQEIAAGVFAAVDKAIRCAACVADGESVDEGATVMVMTGPARGILTAERTALNFLQRLSGIATQTRAFVERVAAYGVTILDTRKTTPGWRALEKYAVRCGGGANHRTGLYDRILIKDNHRALRAGAGGVADLEQAVRDARQRYPDLAVEVEVESEAEFVAAMRAEPEWILLDNMAPERLSYFVALAGGRVRLEASGGITLATIEAVAATGVDAVSLGCLTHSVKAVDLSLEIGTAG